MSNFFSAYLIDPVRRTRLTSDLPRLQEAVATPVPDGHGSPVPEATTAEHREDLGEENSMDVETENNESVAADTTSRLPTRIPEVARANGLQGLIPLDNIRSEYEPEVTDAQAEAVPVVDSQGVHVQNAGSIDEATLESFSSMSLDSRPPVQSSNPLFGIDQRLFISNNLHRMSTDSIPLLLNTDSGMSRSREGSASGGSTMSGSLPADDGMREMRAKIRRIKAMALSSEESARRMHELMTSAYRKLKGSAAEGDRKQGRWRTKSRRGSQSANDVSGSASLNGDSENVYRVRPKDLEPTYCPARPALAENGDKLDGEEVMEDDELALGCVHYMRNIKVQCADCKHWHTCRNCHDAVEDHRLERKKIANMLCMLCGTPQPAGPICSQCGVEAAAYYCGICRLWENDVQKKIYHCPECGICRRGEGLGKDFLHCKRCNVCISIRWADKHKCVERATECDCPICGDYMFSSSDTVVAVRCGHYMHKDCYQAYINANYRCPMCARSMVNMALQWRKIDDQIAMQPMPAEFSKTQAFISCNDCAGKSLVAFHWLGLKCATCDSYNTVRLRLIDPPEHEPVAEPSLIALTAGDALRSFSGQESNGSARPVLAGSNDLETRTPDLTDDSVAANSEPITNDIALPLPVPRSVNTTGTHLEIPSGLNVGHHTDSMEAYDAAESNDEESDDDGRGSFWGGAGTSPQWMRPSSWMSPSFLATLRSGDAKNSNNPSGNEPEDAGSTDSFDDIDDIDEDEDDDIDEMELIGHP